ncbi:MAG: hypothetical protein JOZ57_00145 [Abitibacteriaceae bacterium]|nr:hypothetical protein [Abditibacteriaceae bacterium]
MQHLPKMFLSRLLNVVLVAGVTNGVGLAPLLAQAQIAQAHTTSNHSTSVAIDSAAKPPSPPAWQNLTVEQRQQLVQQMRLQARDDNLKRMLGNAGFTDPKLQDALVTFIKAEEQAVQPYRDKGRKLIEALRSKTLTDAQLAMLLNDFRAAAEDEKQRRTAAQQALDKQIAYTRNPRLEAYLRLLGLVGDEASLLVGTESLGNGTG